MPSSRLGEAVWFLFGAALLPLALEHFSASIVVYALLSLSVIRMVPVGVSLVGAGMDGSTVLSVGWFGPRGLASVVFSLLAVEELGESRPVGQAVSVVATTVLLSVVLHGVSAGPLGGRYVAAYDDHDPSGEPTSRRTGRPHRSGA